MKQIGLIIIMVSVLLMNGFSQDQDYEKLIQGVDEVQKLFDEIKLDSAITKLDSLIVKFPNSPTLFLMKGDAIANFSQLFSTDSLTYQNAMHNYDLALGLSESYFEAHLARGKLNYTHHYIYEALNDISSAIKFSETEFQRYRAISDRAIIFIFIKEYDKAIIDFKDMLKIEPESVAAYANLAFLYISKKEYKKAEDLCLKAIELDPDDILFRNNLGLIYLETERYQEAEDIITKFFSEDPRMKPIMLNNRGFARLKLGKIEQAKKDIHDSISLYPDNAYAFRNKALLEIEQNEMVNACKSLEHALALNFTQLYGEEVEELIKVHCK